MQMVRWVRAGLDRAFQQELGQRYRLVTAKESAMASKLTFNFDSLSAAIVIGAVVLRAGTAHAVELNPAGV
jgi:hypothetical protein